MAAYRRVYLFILFIYLFINSGIEFNTSITHSRHLQADCQEPGSAAELYAQ